MRPLTISELERATNVPRSTIYFYVREGLLPPGQKAAASRAIYTDVHAELLREITRLKKAGWSLEAIRRELEPRIREASLQEVDLVAEQAEQTRKALLAAAARLFVRKGYKRTRVADIIQEVGVTAPVFYSHFPSKQQLFVEAFGLFVSWMRDALESRLVMEPDPAARDLSRVQAYLGLQAVSPDLLSLVRSEAMHENGEMREVVKNAYNDMVRGTLSDLTEMRQKSNAVLPAADELVAFALLGGVENMVMRSSWDDKYSTRDVLWSTLCLFLAVEALYTGRLEIREQLSRYAELVNRIAQSPPPVPPAAQE